LPIKPIPLFPGHLRPEPVVSELCAQRKRLREERKRIGVAHAVKTVGVVVVRGCLGLRHPIFKPALAVGGRVASVIGVALGKLTLLISKPAAQHVVGVVALPVVGQAAVHTGVVTK